MKWLRAVGIGLARPGRASAAAGISSFLRRLNMGESPVMCPQYRLSTAPAHRLRPAPPHLAPPPWSAIKLLIFLIFETVNARAWAAALVRSPFSCEKFSCRREPTDEITATNGSEHEEGSHVHEKDAHSGNRRFGRCRAWGCGDIPAGRDGPG